MLDALSELRHRARFVSYVESMLDALSELRQQCKVCVICGVNA